jgi:hypothetical protein
MHWPNSQCLSRSISKLLFVKFSIYHILMVNALKPSQLWNEIYLHMVHKHHSKYMWDHMWNRWVECWEVGLIVGFCDLAIQNIWIAMPMRNYFGINHFYKIDNKWHDLAYGNYQCHSRPIVLIDHTSLEMYVDVYVNWILVG